MLGLASCQNDPEGFDVTVNGEVSTKVTVNLADATGTRAVAGRDSANSAIKNGVVEDTDYTLRYILQVFEVLDKNNAAVAKAMDFKYSDNTSVDFDVRLVPGRDYRFVVWADIVEANDVVDGEKCEDNHYAIGDDLRNISLIDTQENPWVAMDETRDAYTGYADVDDYTSTSGIEIELKRPFAKLRVITNDIKELFSGNPCKAVVDYDTPHYNAFNAFSATYSGEVDKVHTYEIDTYTSEDPTTTGKQTLFADYFFANEEVVKFSLSVYEDAEMNNLMRTTYFNTDIPVKRNYLTTITGNVLTDGNKVNVEIEDEFGNSENPNDPPYYVELWDGESMVAPLDENNDNIYEIERPSELAWLAAAVNGTLTEDYTRSAVAANDFAGKTFRLTENIDLDNKPWTPIGDADNHIFKGTFNGNGKIIKNLVVNGNSNKNQGLFGKTGGNARFENVIIENAKVSGRLNVGALVGEPEGATAENIKLLGHVEVNGLAYVGGVAGKHVTADWNNITVNVDETSYVKAHSIENGTAYRSYVGGVVGFMQAHKHKLSNVTSNINVKGSTSDVGGIVGIAHYNNEYENIVCTGNVEIYAAEEAADAQKIGGIAGTWYNGVDYKKQPVTVTMTNCSFEGNLTTNIENVKFYYDGLVGKYYDANDNTGKLILNGKQYVASAAELQAAVNAATGETTLYLGYDIVGDVTVVQKQGVKITIEGENKKFNGSIKVHSNSNYYADAALTIKNVNFETSAASVNVIEALENGSERYSQNIAVENCTFTATGEAANTSVAVQVKATRGVTVTGCTATNMHSLIQAQSCDTGDVKVINSTVNGKNGVAFKQVKSATVEGTTITALEYGIRFDGNIDNYGIVVKNNNVTAVQPLIVRKMTGKNNTIALEGTNTLTTEAEYQIVVTNGSDDEEYVKPTGTYTLTGADEYTIFPAPFPVASWDEFTAALAAGEDWIKLTADISTSAGYTLTKDLKLELNGKAFAIDNATECLYIGDKNNTTKPNVTFKGGNLNCMVYGLSGNVTIKDVVFGGTVSYVSAYQGVVSTKHANLLMENCKMTNVKKSGSTKPRSLCTEGRSSGYLILRDCNFKNSNLDRPYINPLNGNTTFELTKCALYGGASNIDLGASYSWTNMNLTGCSGGFTFTISRASTSLTDEEMAVYKAIKKNNSGSMRFIFSDGEKNNL